MALPWGHQRGLHGGGGTDLRDVERRPSRQREGHMQGWRPTRPGLQGRASVSIPPDRHSSRKSDWKGLLETDREAWS